MDNKTCYQPRNERGELPEELAPFMAFDTREHCISWMGDNLYPEDEYPVRELQTEEIDGLVLIDEIGNYLDGTGSVGCYNTEKNLEEGYNSLIDTIRRAMDKTGLGFLRLDKNPCMLYEDYSTLGCDVETEPVWDDYPTIVGVDSCTLYDDEGNEIEFGDITDYDDYMMLVDAISLEFGL